MRLFMVTQQGFGKQSMQVLGSGAPPAPSQFFDVVEANHLLTIDFIVDMAEGQLRFANGPGTIGAAPAPNGLTTREARSAELDSLLKAHD